MSAQTHSPKIPLRGSTTAADAPELSKPPQPNKPEQPVPELSELHDDPLVASPAASMPKTSACGILQPDLERIWQQQVKIGDWDGAVTCFGAGWRHGETTKQGFVAKRGALSMPTVGGMVGKAAVGDDLMAKKEAASLPKPPNSQNYETQTLRLPARGPNAVKMGSSIFRTPLYKSALVSLLGTIAASNANKVFPQAVTGSPNSAMQQLGPLFGQGGALGDPIATGQLGVGPGSATRNQGGFNQATAGAKTANSQYPYCEHALQACLLGASGAGQVMEDQMTNKQAGVATTLAEKYSPAPKHATPLEVTAIMEGKGKPRVDNMESFGQDTLDDIGRVWKNWKYKKLAGFAADKLPMGDLEIVDRQGLGLDITDRWDGRKLAFLTQGGELGLMEWLAKKYPKGRNSTNVAYGHQKRADKLPGGLADNKSTTKYPADQVAQGTKVEMEHTNDKKLSKEITKDHLEEHSDYYTRLKNMEDRADAGMAPTPGPTKQAATYGRETMNILDQIDLLKQGGCKKPKMAESYQRTEKVADDELLKAAQGITGPAAGTGAGAGVKPGQQMKMLPGMKQQAGGQLTARGYVNQPQKPIGPAANAMPKLPPRPQNLEGTAAAQHKNLQMQGTPTKPPGTARMAWQNYTYPFRRFGEVMNIW